MTHQELAAEVDDVARIAARAVEDGGTREDLTESLRTLSARLFELVADFSMETLHFHQKQ